MVKIDQVVASGKTTRVNLDKQLDIIIGYATAYVCDGQLYFKNDIYTRDPGVLEGLDDDFKVRRQDQVKH